MAWACMSTIATRQTVTQQVSPAPRKKKKPNTLLVLSLFLSEHLCGQALTAIISSCSCVSQLFSAVRSNDCKFVQYFFESFSPPVGVKHFIRTSPAPQPTSVCPRLYIERNQAVYNQFLSALQFTSVIWQKVCHSTSNLSLFTGQWLGNKSRSWLILLLMEGVKICTVGLVAAPVLHC
jgi:hypothetical protein